MAIGSASQFNTPTKGYEPHHAQCSAEVLLSVLTSWTHRIPLHQSLDQIFYQQAISVS